MSLRYRLVLPTGTLGSSISYFKKKISPTRSEHLCSWDGKGAMCEVRGREFKSQTKRIFCINFKDLGTGWFIRYQRLSLWYHFGGTGSKNQYQRHSPTGAKSSFSSSVLTVGTFPTIFFGKKKALESLGNNGNRNSPLTGKIEIVVDHIYQLMGTSYTYICF